MRMFKDENDKPWVIKIDVAAVKRVRGLLNVDIYKLVSKGMEPLSELMSDIVGLVDLIYVLCMEQATADGVTDVQFGRALRGDSLEAAAVAFTEELIDFFPDAKTRGAMTQMIAASRKVKDKMISLSEAKLAEASSDEAVQALIDSYTTSRALSVSTPTPSPSAS